MGRRHHWRVVLGRPCSWWVLEVGHHQRWWEVVGGVRRSWGGVRRVGGRWFVGWCWKWAVGVVWAVVVIRGVVLGCCQRSWGGAGPGSSSPMLGVVMGHRLGGGGEPS